MDLPEWVSRETRAMPAMALRVMAEVFAVGVMVKDREGRAFAHVPNTLANALGLPSATVSRVLPMLLDGGLLVEHPGTLDRGGRLWPTYSAPMVQPAERAALQELRFPFHKGEGSFSKVEDAPAPAPNLPLPGVEPEPAAFEPAPSDLEDAPGEEGRSILESANEGAGAQGQEHHQQQAAASTISTNAAPNRSLHNTEQSAASPAPAGMLPASAEAEVRSLCLAGLKAIGVGRPENVMLQFDLNSIAGALEMLVMKLHRGEPVEGKGAAYVMHFLHGKAQFAPIEDYGFLRYFSQEADPKVVQFSLRRKR